MQYIATLSAAPRRKGRRSPARCAASRQCA
jgi:hypothetical protein